MAPNTDPIGNQRTVVSKYEGGDRPPLSIALLALAGSFQSGGFAMEAVKLFWAFASAIVIFEILVSNAYVNAHIGFAKKKPLAILVSVAVPGIFLFFGYVRPPVVLTIANEPPFVVVEQSTGIKWVKIQATKAAHGETICWAFLDSLSRNTDMGYILPPGEHRRLTADDGGDPGLGQGFHLGGGAERLFNIATARADTKTMHIESKAFNDLITVPLGPAVYYAKIEVSGVDCGPAFIDIKIVYSSGLDISVSPARSSWWFL